MVQDFGPAHVQYDDWRGTVSLDNPDDDGDLYRIAGVDREKWLICGIDIYGLAGMGIQASVLAVPRDAIKKFEDWKALTRDNDGYLPVTQFDLREGTALALLGSFKRSNIRATLRHPIADSGLEVLVVDTVHPPEEPGVGSDD